MPSPRRTVSPPWWEAWVSLAALATLGVMIFRVIVMEPTPLDAVDAVMMTVAYVGVAVELFYGLARRMR
ncbi:MAG: hypothetical protein ACRDRA_05975 [Pseudonocardiaceae bacterium]